MTERPKEYIISRDHAEEYAKLYAEANTADFAKMTEVRRVANDFLKQIRSRPVSTLPGGAAPELMQTVYRCCEFYEAPTLDNPKSGCKMVQAAREKVLDEAIAIILDDCCPVEETDCKDGCAICKLRYLKIGVTGKGWVKCRERRQSRPWNVPGKERRNDAR